MGAYPGSKARRGRGKGLGKGQAAAALAVVVTADAVTTVVTLTFGEPVVVSGQVPLIVVGHADVPEQVVTSPTTVTLTFDATCAGDEWVIVGGGPEVRSFQGGALAPASGTFSG